MKRLARNEPQDPGRARVTARDMRLLAFVAAAQPVSTAHIRVFLQVSLPIARRILRRCKNMRLLNAYARFVEQENCYCLAKAGRDLLADALEIEPKDLRMLRSGSVSDHHLGVVAIMSALVNNAASGLIDFLFERDLRKRMGRVPKGSLLPDAISMHAYNGQRVALAWEVDTGTERNPSWLVRHKLEPYSELHDAGAPMLGSHRWRVLLVAPKKRRLNRLLQATWQAEIPEDVVAFALSSEMTVESILDRVWRVPRLSPDGSTAAVVHEAPWPVSGNTHCDLHVTGHIATNPLALLENPNNPNLRITPNPRGQQPTLTLSGSANDA